MVIANAVPILVVAMWTLASVQGGPPPGCSAQYPGYTAYSQDSQLLQSALAKACGVPTNQIYGVPGVSGLTGDSIASGTPLCIPASCLSALSGGGSPTRTGGSTCGSLRNFGGQQLILNVNDSPSKIGSACDCQGACKNRPPCNTWVFCPESGGCGYDCSKYQENSAVKTQCAPDDGWPSHMCSLKVTADSDGGDSTGGGSWLGGKIPSSGPSCGSPRNFGGQEVVRNTNDVGTAVGSACNCQKACSGNTPGYVNTWVYCPSAGGCGSQCGEYQQNGGVKTHCTSDDKWPFNMCSCKNTWVHDSGDPSDTGGWIAGKL